MLKEMPGVRKTSFSTTCLTDQLKRKQIKQLKISLHAVNWKSQLHELQNHTTLCTTNYINLLIGLNLPTFFESSSQ